MACVMVIALVIIGKLLEKLHKWERTLILLSWFIDKICLSLITEPIIEWKIREKTCIQQKWQCIRDSSCKHNTQQLV